MPTVEKFDDLNSFENEMNDMNTQSSQQERISYEKILFLQINRINQILSSNTEDNIKKSQFNHAMFGLDASCEPLKDKAFNDAMVLLAKQRDLEITTWKEENSNIRIMERDAVITMNLVNIDFTYNKRLFPQLMLLLQRKGRLWKTVGVGQV